MPEGPEVKLLSETISKGLLLKKIQQVKIWGGKYAESKQIPNLSQLIESLPLNVMEIGCKGKFVHIKLENEMSIGIHFGMTGTVHYQPNPKTQIQLICQDQTTLCYDDQRRFGNWHVFINIKELNTKLSKIGHDILTELPIDSEIVRKFRLKNNWNICKFLMDQSFFSGIGNYIKSESLYQQSIHPLAIIQNLTDSELIQLYKTCHQIATKSYQLQGSTFISYRNNGESGKYQQLFQIYGKKLDPDNNPVKKIKTPDNRMTSYVVIRQTHGFDLAIV